MGFNDRDEDLREYRSFLQQLIDNDKLEGSALGITKYVIQNSETDLSKKQAYIFEREVKNKFILERCKICSSTIPWSEMFEAANIDQFVMHSAGHPGQNFDQNAQLAEETGLLMIDLAHHDDNDQEN